eukprot:364003-Chlamydomonas_euryale.AAC.20
MVAHHACSDVNSGGTQGVRFLLRVMSASISKQDEHSPAQAREMAPPAAFSLSAQSLTTNAASQCRMLWERTGCHAGPCQKLPKAVILDEPATPLPFSHSSEHGSIRAGRCSTLPRTPPPGGCPAQQAFRCLHASAATGQLASALRRPRALRGQEAHLRDMRLQRSARERGSCGSGCRRRTDGRCGCSTPGALVARQNAVDTRSSCRCCRAVTQFAASACGAVSLCGLPPPPPEDVFGCARGMGCELAGWGGLVGAAATSWRREGRQWRARLAPASRQGRRPWVGDVVSYRAGRTRSHRHARRRLLAGRPHAGGIQANAIAWRGKAQLHALRMRRRLDSRSRSLCHVTPLRSCKGCNSQDRPTPSLSPLPLQSPLPPFGPAAAASRGRRSVLPFALAAIAAAARPMAIPGMRRAAAPEGARLRPKLHLRD